ncbi:hypothetical protein GOP47_0007548 [Adiantum capillus-veneris]|uniref:NAB domain-containing protein n=1 Tax=Adiantum capillus-veneris TaxID=13818 RepID=A0A9D4ZJE6_ADICA|nr:hypothetical protein GOP47_0007548 [Adiantum capillus-veneris]
MTLERSPSHSWWWNSHNSPKHSKWLQLNLQELDEKVKEMLSLIEEDADSFAKRAEMYYQKRPELVNLVEEFYRAYRSLAERYDYLAGNIRQNIPKALQVQFGLSCDSPKSKSYSGRQHHYSPLRRSDQTFDNLLKKVGQAEDEMEDSYPIEKMQAPERVTTEDNDGSNYPFLELANGNCHLDSSVEFCIREDNVSSKESSSDAEGDNLTPLEKLQQEIENLEMENRLLIDANKKVLQLNNALEKKVEDLEDHFRSMHSEAGMRSHEFDRLNQRELGEPNSNATVAGKASRYKDNSRDASFIESLGTDLNACCDSGSINDCDTIEYQEKDSFFDVDRQAFACTLTTNCSVLMEENEALKQALSERGEEKREAIRQLCLSIDMLKRENQKLVALIASKKKRLQSAQHAPWLKLFCLG